LRTFVAYNTDDTLRQLTSFMVAKSSGVPGEYGRLIAYEFTNTDAPGPAAVAANINAQQEVAARITVLNQQGSTVEYGDLLLIPIDNSILYVRPLYVTARDSDFPALSLVMVSNGEDVALGNSLGEALDRLFRSGTRFTDLIGTTAVTNPDVEPPDTNGGGTPSGDVDERITELVSQILTKRAEADAARRQDPPDNATAGAAEDEIRQLLDELAELTGASEGAVTTTTPASTSGGDDGGAGESPTTTVPPTTTVRPASA
jgi:uncharacterized membrane protein (UPF0182 family)